MAKQPKQGDMVECPNPNCREMIPLVREGDFFRAYHACNKYGRRVSMIQIPIVHSEPASVGFEEGETK
jgi:hypothetical protein